VEVHADVDLVAHDVAYLGEAVDRRLYRGGGLDPAELRGGVHLHRRQSRLDTLAGRLPDRRGPVAADPAVHSHSIPDRPAEQFVRGRAERLPAEVPQRLVEPGDGRHVDRAAAVEPPAVHRLPVVLDGRGVLAEQPGLGERLHRRGDGPRADAGHALAPPDLAVARLQADQQPPRRDVEQFVVCEGRHAPAPAVVSTAPFLSTVDGRGSSRPVRPVSMTASRPVVRPGPRRWYRVTTLPEPRRR